ncbi:hypothetical protein B0H19DRAFT_1227240 [Mycena capillaripes]|nr:hypothetical protein B0H19DRAFT_1227240 [Mycena capillaripes]
MGKDRWMEKGAREAGGYQIWITDFEMAAPRRERRGGRRMVGQTYGNEFQDEGAEVGKGDHISAGLGHSGPSNNANGRRNEIPALSEDTTARSDGKIVGEFNFRRRWVGTENESGTSPTAASKSKSSELSSPCSVRCMIKAGGEEPESRQGPSTAAGCGPSRTVRANISASNSTGSVDRNKARDYSIVLVAPVIEPGMSRGNHELGPTRTDAEFRCGIRVLEVQLLMSQSDSQPEREMTSRNQANWASSRNRCPSSS